MLVIVASITIILSLQRLIQSQSREIAIIRTLGVPRNSIMIGYMLAPLAIGLIGSALGVLLGVFFGIRVMLDVYEDIIGLPILNETVDWNMVVEIVAIAMVIVFLSGIWPAWKASRMKPLEVLSGQHEVRVGSKFLQTLTAGLPTTIGLTIRSSLRKPIRLSLTFLAVGLSMVIYGSVLMFATDGSAMRLVNLVDGELPAKETATAQILADEGTAALLDWDLNEKRTVKLGTMEIEVELVGTTRGEISRTIYFHRTFLENDIGIEATSVYIRLEEGGSVDGNLADV